MNIEKIWKWVKIYFGIKIKKQLTGPYQLELRILNFCNTNCVACFNHSPLKKEKGHKITLKTSKIKEVIKSAKKLDVKEIIISGDGEPLLHPDIIEIISEIKKHRIRSIIFTNGILLSKDLIDELLISKIDEVRCSVWAGDNQTYMNTHPNATEETFEELKSNLRYLKQQKGSPKLVIYNTIFKTNYKKIQSMFSFADYVEADDIYFSNLSVRNHLQSLVLSDDEKTELNKIIKKMKFQSSNIHQLLNEKQKLSPCYQGYVYTQINSYGEVLPCCSSTRFGKVGEINNSSLESIWDSKKYEQFRKHKKGLDVSSYNCQNCSSSGFNKIIHNKLKIRK